MESKTKTILTGEMVEKIIRKAFGETQVQHVHIFTEGWFNAVYAVDFTDSSRSPRAVVIKTSVEDGKYVLSYERDIMKAELAVYDAIRGTIIPAPRILARDFDRDIVGCDYFIMEKLPGDNWGHLEKEITPENHERLVAELARYTAALHQIHGGWFGYLREDPAYHYPTWREAFEGMVRLQIRDGERDGVDMPYAEILSAFAPYWGLLEDVKEPCLIDFDMWKKNIMLRKEGAGYVIDGILDYERAFYGDPCAEFVASNTIVGDVSQSALFIENYSAISGRPFVFTARERVRLIMYDIYLSLLMGVEVYRYDEQDTQRMLGHCRRRLQAEFAQLKEAGKKL